MPFLIWKSYLNVNAALRAFSKGILFQYNENTNLNLISSKYFYIVSITCYYKSDETTQRLIDILVTTIWAISHFDTTMLALCRSERRWAIEFCLNRFFNYCDQTLLNESPCRLDQIPFNAHSWWRNRSDNISTRGGVEIFILSSAVNFSNGWINK